MRSLQRPAVEFRVSPALAKPLLLERFADDGSNPAHRAGFAPFPNGVESIGDREFDGGGGREF